MEVLVLLAMVAVPAVLALAVVRGSRRSSRTITTAAPPGWYADPEASDSPSERWWDGSRWTEQRRTPGG